MQKTTPISRQGIVVIFSSFIQFECENFSKWVSDPHLRRSMEKSLQAQSDRQITESFWCLYWHSKWKKQPESIAKGHLIAYLQEICFWSSQKTSNTFISNQYSTFDCFQLAISGVDKVLKGFNSKKNSSFRNYASTSLKNSIREGLRQQKEIDICSEWSLLRKISQKILSESLFMGGFTPGLSNKYILAWNCFKQIYVPQRSSVTQKLPKPDLETWKKIAKLYNQKTIQESVSEEQLEEWLLVCVEKVRSYLYPNIASINQKKPGWDDKEIIDDLGTIGTEDSLLMEMIAEEDTQERKEKQNNINQVLISALEKLKQEERDILKLYYAQNLKQGEIASILGTQQYSISRQLTRIRKFLLKYLAKWSQEKLHISLTSDILKNISGNIEEWLEGHYNVDLSKL